MNSEKIYKFLTNRGINHNNANQISKGTANKAFFYYVARKGFKLSHSNANKLYRNLTNDNASEFRRLIFNTRNKERVEYYFRTRALGCNHRTAMNVVTGNVRGIPPREKAQILRRLTSTF
jgi:hypothetical protein